MRCQRDPNDHAPGGRRRAKTTRAYRGPLNPTCSPALDRVLRWCTPIQCPPRNPARRVGPHRLPVQSCAVAPRSCGPTLRDRSSVLSGHSGTNECLGRTASLARCGLGPMVLPVRGPLGVRLSYRRADRMLLHCRPLSGCVGRPSWRNVRPGNLWSNQVLTAAGSVTLRTNPLDCRPVAVHRRLLGSASAPSQETGCRATNSGVTAVWCDVIDCGATGN